VPGEPYDDRALETQDLLGILYFIVEVSRTDETFGDEISESNLFSEELRDRARLTIQWALVHHYLLSSSISSLDYETDCQRAIQSRNCSCSCGRRYWRAWGE
jgi:hypothetical protein